MRYFEVCFRPKESICIRGEQKPSKWEAEKFLMMDAKECGYDLRRGVTRVVELSKEEAHDAFDMENEELYPIFTAKR